MVSAMRKDFDSSVENNTFEWQKALRDKNIVGSRWVYALKYKQDRSFEYKSRIVTKGYSQIYSKDYWETFVPKTKISFHKVTSTSRGPIWLVNTSYGC